MSTVHVFYAGKLFKTCPVHHTSLFLAVHDAPDGAYIKFHPSLASRLTRGVLWYRSDFTPVAPEDVPAEYRMLDLLLT